MTEKYSEIRKSQNLYPLVIPNKEELYFDLMNIEHSWSGRIDTNVGNTFIMEANQLLINAIELFELGYFDCAYYSLRSAIDVSTTMVFLVDMPDESRNKYLQDWKNLSDFPLRIGMIKKLSSEGSEFVDMYSNMPTFFEKAKAISQKLNKYVHKQGLHNFYISKNHPMNNGKSRESFIKDFVNHLSEVIGIVAVMRLAIDPFPILLMDEEILYRCFDSMTTPYTQDFVQKYIGDEILAEYKNTNFFSVTKESFANEEKKTPAVFDVVKHQVINTNKFEEISKQFHLMTEEDCVATVISNACKKVVKVYCVGGLRMYFTDRKTNRKKLSWCGTDFLQFENSSQQYNQQYDEAFISVFKYKDSGYKDVSYFVEHNDILLEEDINSIKNSLGELSKKFQF